MNGTDLSSLLPDVPLCYCSSVPKDQSSLALLSQQQRRLIDAADAIQTDQPDRADFLHTVLCQVAMPRRQTDQRVFRRQSGGVNMILEAGRLWNGVEWVEQPLPYSTQPRLVMVHISSEAVRTQNRRIAVGDSIRDFLNALGISPTGGARGGYTMFKKQMEALAACRLTLGMTTGGRAVTVDAKPIKKFEAWIQLDGEQRSLWPGAMELSQEFFDTLVQHAVPLDPRALGALRHSSLALDVYTWLAYRLCRVQKLGGTKVSVCPIRGSKPICDSETPVDRPWGRGD